MLIGSLFSGIGGLELGLDWSGLGETLWQVEQDKFCLQILKIEKSKRSFRGFIKCVTCFLYFLYFCS